MKASSSSSGSSSSSSSSSGTDTGSSSSDESSSSAGAGGARSETPAKSTEKVVTRRKSSEIKAATSKAAELEKNVSSLPTSSSKSRGNANVPRAPCRLSTVSSEDDILPAKKSTRPTNNAPSGTQRRKTSVSSNATQSLKPGQNSGIGGGGKAPPSGVKNQPTDNINTKYPAMKVGAGGVGVKQQESSGTNSAGGNGKESSNAANVLGKELPKQIKTTKLPIAALANINSASRLKHKVQPKRNVTTKSITRRKSSAESDSESASESGDESSTTSGSDATDSTNSFTLHQAKATKGKRGYTASKLALPSDSDELNARNQEVTPRKLTRSLSTRRTKQQLRQGGGEAGGMSESESDALLDLDAEKRSLSKSPAKKPSVTKCKTKKDIGTNMLPSKPCSQSPPQQLEKKCPIEGCDSSGHLSGNSDRHFLPEACPIYHNMSASECKERANERKTAKLLYKTCCDEHRQKSNGETGTTALNANSSGMNAKTLTPEQKDFLAKIRESRARFKPLATAISCDKVKLGKDCTDEDREPCLVGLVPDYDLQLFREAQAIASENIEDELKDLPVGKGIKYITMGKYKMKVWYQSPYPDDAARLPKMYICEFCLRYQKSETGIKRHAQKCIWRHPPGDEIYRKGKLQVWQVDGKRHKQYCQHLCLLAKFFLDHKTLYYDVEPFLFYIMTLADVDGCHTVGYFSKEKNSFYNVSCILTLPPYQRKGYGRLLIDFSYLLTRVEQKVGSPEKPLSDLGLISYRSYWKDVLLDYLCNRSGNTLSIKDVSQEMAIYSYDIVSTLQALGMMKYWKGKHIVLKKQDVLEEYEKRVKHRGNFPKIDDTCLRWSPFVPTQNSNTP